MSASDEQALLLELKNVVHQLYQTNDGPRLIAEVLKEYPAIRSLRGRSDAMTKIPATSTV